MGLSQMDYFQVPLLKLVKLCHQFPSLLNRHILITIAIILVV